MLLAMEISLIKSRGHFRELVLDFLWRQWGSIGVAGNSRGHDAWMIDPEALLLATTTFGRFEPRLFDEVLDWLNTNSQAINLQRLQNLGETFGQRSVLCGMAAHLVRRTINSKWRTLLRDVETAPVIATEVLFPDVPVVGEVDSLFAQHGWRRGPVKLRQLSQGPNPDQVTNLLFKLRSLFGVQARAEVMAFLLTHESGHPAEMAERLAYFPRSIQTTLNDMERSGHVLSGRSGREKRFWLRRDEWSFLITWQIPERQFPTWIDWAPRFIAMEAIWKFLHRNELESAPAGVQAIELRAALEKLSPEFLRENVQMPAGVGGTEFVASVLDSFQKILS